MVKKRTSLFVLTLMLSAINVWSFSLVTTSSSFDSCTVLGDQHAFQSPSYIPYQIESGFLGGSSTNKNAVRRAFTTWDADNAYLGYGEVGSGVCGGTSDGVCIDSVYSASSWLAVTWSWYSGNTITHSDIDFNTRYSWGVNPSSGTYDIEAVAMHEVGHTMGLHHPNTCDNHSRNYDCNLSVVPAAGTEVMNSSVPSGTQSHILTLDDRCGSAYIYNSGTYIPPTAPDITPPEAVTDLAFTLENEVGLTTDVRFTWTAPGDDGSEGTAIGYNFRYREDTPINASNWATSISISGEPAPSLGGTSEVWVNQNSNEDTRYYAMMTVDEAGNWSSISNTVTIIFDTAAPDPITDLSIIDSELSSVTLQWTATGDDGAVGTAISSDLRYSTSSIDSGNFATATQVSGVFSPQVAGTTENFMVYGLTSGTTYYFAIMAYDNYSFSSGISNVPSITLSADADGDGLSDADEITYGTSSSDTDSDGDGMGDLEEIVAGTDPNDNQSFSDSLYVEDFDVGSTLGDLSETWTTSGQTSNVTWDISSSALVSTVTGSSYGYSFAAPFGKDFSDLKEWAISYDVTFENGATWGGLWFRGVHLDVNLQRCAWRDNSFSSVATPLISGTKHHVLLEVREAVPFYLSDLYVDGYVVFLDEPIEVGLWANETVGFASPYYTGNTNIDNFTVWPIPVMTPLSESFNRNNLGVWELSGNTNINWSLDVGGLKSEVLSSGYGYAEHALLEVDATKDILVKFNFEFKNGAAWGGFLYRDIYLDLNPTRIGWRDDSFTYVTSTMTLDTQHEAVLFITQSPSLQSTIYVDGALIYLDEPIEAASFTDDTVGFVSNYYGGEIIFDNFYIEVVDSGVDLAPVFMGLTNQSVLGGETLSYQMSALDAEGSSLTFSSPDIGSLPGGATLSTGGLLTWSPAIVDAGTYSLTVEVSAGSVTTSEVIQIAVNTDGVEAIIYTEDFESALPLGDGWQESGAGNVDWTLVSGELDATVSVSGGYSYYAPELRDFSTYTNLAIEYDVEFKDGAQWGGLWFRGVHLDLNPSRTGWRDGIYQWYSGFSMDVKHHVIVFVRDIGGGSYESDLYVDGVPLFLNELIDTTTFPETYIGFVSPYFTGRTLIDNYMVYDFSLLSATPPTTLHFYDDYSSGNTAGWIGAGSTTNTNWTVINNSLVASKTSSGGYSYLWPFALNVTDEHINIEFDVTYKDGAKWGGLYYRGLYLDLNLNRVGWRDDSYTYENSPMVEGQTYHVKVTIDQFLYSEVYIDGVQIFQTEAQKTIESTSFSNNSVGFVSSYYSGHVIFDNFLVEEN